MASNVLGPYAFPAGNGDRKAGYKAQFSCSGGVAVGYDTNTYVYSNVSVTLNMSNTKYYSLYGYFNVYNQNGDLVGRTKQWNNAENTSHVQASGASSVNITFTLINVDTANALNTSSFYLILARSNSGTGNLCNIRNTNTATLTINYTRTLRNSAPGWVKSIDHPAANYAYTYNQKPYFKATMGTDPDGDNLQLGWAIYDNTAGSWPVATQWISTWYANGATVTWQCSTSLTRDHLYTLYCYQRDTSNAIAESGSTSKSFYVGTPIGAISAGSLMDDTIIDNLQAQINNLRTYYGLGNYSFTTCNAGTRALDDHVDQLEVAFEATPHKTDVASVDAGTKIVPAHINNIRNGLLNG